MNPEVVQVRMVTAFVGGGFISDRVRNGDSSESSDRPDFVKCLTVELAEFVLRAFCGKKRR